jgi:5-deoxy-glucuronate isomerase
MFLKENIMEERLLRGSKEIAHGYTTIAEIDGRHAEMLMDFGVLILKAGESYTERKDLECVYLLVHGDVEFAWEENSVKASRRNCFDDGPWLLHVPPKTRIRITCNSTDCEITIHRTGNDKEFESKLYGPSDIPDEIRGAGTMNEAGTRKVRTVLDKTLAPWSNFVFGEVINTPGKWSSYPPHTHPQPEIYYYKTLPGNGYGYCEYGDDVYKVYNNDTVFILPNYTHPQVAAPGYALWYMWVIRQFEHDPYQPQKYPHFLEEHDWVRKPGAVIWK